ncbi:unnamed protein product [Pylaiella littoralis]
MISLPYRHQLVSLLLVLVLVLQPPSARAIVYNVSASGSGLDLYEAMDLAEAGDTVSLADGTYDGAIVSTRDGTKDNPITVVGGADAIINGEFGDRSVHITHSFMTLKGFSVQGKIGPSNSTEDYVEKCVYVEGTGGVNSSSPLDGFVMEGLSIENCGGECVRLKDYVVNANITGNTIQNCGIYDYEFPSDEKNGEGVYIGTSSNQWTYGPDACDNNVVKANNISTSGNECVDIKEGATGNIIEDNVCSNQLDANSGCYDSRGDGNTFRYNVGSDCVGAGVRLGGWEIDGHQYGVNNSVYGNRFLAVGFGAIKILVAGQGDICGNSCEDGSCGLTGNALAEIRETWDEACGDVGGPSTSSFIDSSLSTSTTEPTPTTVLLSSQSSTATSDDGSASSEESTDEGSSQDIVSATAQSEGSDVDAYASTAVDADDEEQESQDDDGDEEDDDDDEEEDGDDDEEDGESKRRRRRRLRGGSY